MRIAKGIYPLKKRRLSLSLRRSLELDETPACIYLAGANGLGKTSFIEKVLITALKAQQVPFLYLGQDFRTQLYTLKAVLAITAKKGVPRTVTNILTRWVGQNRHARVFILDEFDKYPVYTEQLFNISRDFIRTYVMVSHADHPPRPGAAFQERRLHFRERTHSGPLVQVTVEETASWSS